MQGAVGGARHPLLDRHASSGETRRRIHPFGNLVIATVGNTRATTQLRQGVNIRRISARLGSPRRFSTYRVKTQSGTVTAAPGMWLEPVS